MGSGLCTRNSKIPSGLFSLLRSYMALTDSACALWIRDGLVGMPACFGLSAGAV